MANCKQKRLASSVNSNTKLKISVLLDLPDKGAMPLCTPQNKFQIAHFYQKLIE
jgi:hypothetical protein